MESIHNRTGDNLYPVTLEVTLGKSTLELDVPAGVWNPTPHGVQLGHMLAEMDFSGKRVLELGTGCGIHAILLAQQGASHLTLTEIERPILDNAEHNLRKHGIDVSLETTVADWTHVVPNDYDVLVTNPPFAKSGKRYRRYFIDTLILDAHKLVRPGGQLVFIQSSMANIPRSIALMEEHGMTVEIVGESDGPFRNYYFEDKVYRKEMAAIPGAYSVRDGVCYERLIVFNATLPG